jgi:lysophospholipase L1-like esterase
LFYGVHSLVGRVGVEPMTTFDGGFYKFPPNFVLRGAAGQGARETAAINNLGFRGPNFTPGKSSTKFRVVCLGESSTFGYRNGDDETYPFLLQKLCNRDRLPVEVINAGFPYYNTGSILSLLRNEILTYGPDLITLYAGYNDTSWPTELSTAGRIGLWVRSHSIAHLLARSRLGYDLWRVERVLYDRVIPQRLRDEAFRKNNDLVAQRYRANVQAIIDLAGSRGIAVVLIRQPATTHTGNYLSMTFEQETRTIQEKFERGEPLSDIETWMLKQHRLMAELDQIAAAAHVPVVDNIDIVDHDRHRLASWVHLTPEANQRLAEALEAAILPHVLNARALRVNAVY